MYVKVILYTSLLMIHNALCYKYLSLDGHASWSKIDEGYWHNYRKIEYLSFVKHEPEMPQFPFYLKIDKSSISTLKPNVLYGCRRMVGVLLSNIKIDTILPGAFNTTTELKEIHLSKNKLTRIENSVFNVLGDLEYLDLSHNFIRNVSDQSFSGLKKLQYLYLQGNEISTMHPNLFESQVDSLLKLDVSSNRLTNVSAVFGRLSHLTHLSLGTNNISETLFDSLTNLTSLQCIDVSNNSIQHVIVSGTGQLSNISLQNNKISSLNDNFFAAEKQYIKCLNISSNILKEINIHFHGMSNLSHLYLQANNISNLASNSFQNLSSLEHLDLSSNSIRELPEDIFSGSKKISHLYLHKNKIMFLDANTFVSQRHSLMILKLSSNTLREVGTVFHELSHLTELHLQENEISSTASDSFRGLVSLEYLDISYNNLERFQFGLMDHLDHLRYLNFSHNKFEEFPLVYLSYLTYLRELVFDNNKIKYLNGSQILKHFPILRKIGMSGNFEWPCPRLATLVKQLRVYHIDIVKGSHFKGSNVRGMACYEDKSVTIDEYYKSDTQDNDNNSKKLINALSGRCNNEITEKNLKHFINNIQERSGNVNVYVTILITIITIALIAITLLQFFFVIKLKRNRRGEQLQLL